MSRPTTSAPSGIILESDLACRHVLALADEVRCLCCFRPLGTGSYTRMLKRDGFRWSAVTGPTWTQIPVYFHHECYLNSLCPGL